MNILNCILKQNHLLPPLFLARHSFKCTVWSFGNSSAAFVISHSRFLLLCNGRPEPTYQGDRSVFKSLSWVYCHKGTKQKTCPIQSYWCVILFIIIVSETYNLLQVFVWRKPDGSFVCFIRNVYMHRCQHSLIYQDFLPFSCDIYRLMSIYSFQTGLIRLWWLNLSLETFLVISIFTFAKS